MNLIRIFIISAVVISSIVTYVISCFFPAYSLNGFEKALEGVLLFSSITLGFYGACLSVLASIFNTKVVKEIMEDNMYRMEFVVISGLSLILGFLTVLTTIVFQVMLENGEIAENVLHITNSVWSFLLMMYIFLIVIFTSVIFMIFLSNADSKTTKAHDGKVGNPDF